MAKLTAISGLGGKGPACFYARTPRRASFRSGLRTQPGLLPTCRVGQVDALLISHSHRDHAGGFALRPTLGDPPVYASDIVRRLLRDCVDSRSLPLRGVTDVLGIKVTTGRSGHAPGGVWLHLAVGGGLLYMGDNCAQSLIYASDEPPACARRDCRLLVRHVRYPLSAVSAAFDAISTGPVLCQFRSPRGPEIALHVLAQRTGKPPSMTRCATRLATLSADDHACLRPVRAR